MKVFAVICVLVIVSASVLADKNDPKTSSSITSTAAQRQARFEDRKLRSENDGKELSTFMNAKNILKTVVKLLFGTDEESRATSRQVLNVFVKVLEMLKTSFGQRARSLNGNRGVKEAVDDAAVAGVSMLKGYVKSILATDDQCAQRHLCESSKEAIRDGREIGHIIAQVGGYATSYLLQHQKSTPFNQSYDAARRGRSGEDCGKIYLNCNETD